MPERTELKPVITGKVDGDDFVVECPTGSGRYLSLRGIADELSRRLTAGVLFSFG